MHECTSASENVKSDLLAAGLVPNKEKSIWTPTQKLDWLGITWDAVEGLIKVVDRRVSNILNSIGKVQELLPYVSARNLASLAGKIISLRPVVGPIAQLKSRFMYYEILNQFHWDRSFKIASDSGVLSELFFWKNEIVSLNKRVLYDYTLPQVLMYSDASGVGCGAWTAQCGGLMFNRSWTSEEVGKSSTWRELKGVALAIEAFVPRISGKVVKVFTDNKGVVVIINKGSMNQELQGISLEIFKLCRSRNIELEIQWVPREQNTKADLLSREIDFDDWGVSIPFFQFVDNLWGPHSVDRFADNLNAKLIEFNSKFWCPGSSHVDAFSVNWYGANNWLVPPTDLVIRVVKHMKVCQAEGTLIIPEWPSAPFWLVLFGENSPWAGMVTEVIRFSDPTHIFVHGRNHKSLFGSSHMKSHVLGVRIKASL
jgi:ribonuclease HI